MAKKKKHEEHENLERWLISYADFITLLFATFVVLYALSQVDIKDFKALEDSIKQAFSAPSIVQGSEGLMQNSTSDSVFESAQADSVITPLMMEYISQKYEEQSMGEIERAVNDAAKIGELNGIEAVRTDKGIIIRFKDDYLFNTGSAELRDNARAKLDKIGVIIAQKFILHNMRVEGHTDNTPIDTVQYPSNWELSSARASTIIRYFIGRFKFMPGLFTAVGFADTRPIATNATEEGRAKNRRVELLILKNKFNSQESPSTNIVKMDKKQQEQLQEQRLDMLSRMTSISDAAKNLTNGDKAAEKNAIVLNKVYNSEIQRISKETQALDNDARSKMTGQGSWLKPRSKIKQIQVFDQH